MNTRVELVKELAEEYTRSQAGTKRLRKLRDRWFLEANQIRLEMEGELKDREEALEALDDLLELNKPRDSAGELKDEGDNGESAHETADRLARESEIRTNVAVEQGADEGAF